MSSAFLVFFFALLLVLNCFLYVEGKHGHFKRSQPVMFVLSCLLMVLFVFFRIL